MPTQPHGRPLLDRLRQMARATIPPGSVIAVVSEGDETLVALPPARGRHFPTRPASSAVPEDGAAAVRWVQEAVDDGVHFLMFPAPALGWLERFPELRAFLEEQYVAVAGRPDIGMVVDLRRPDDSGGGAREALGPSTLAVEGPNFRTIAFLESTGCRRIAEIGVYRGYTSARLAAHLGGEGELHIFDYEDVVEDVSGRLAARGFTNVIAHGNSRKILDSYNWSLMRLVRDNEGPLFDYVFLDGAHSWAADALAFVLIDRLLEVGGFIDLDDYAWSFARSMTQNPMVRPAIRELYTDEQIETPQVALVVDLLIRRDGRYEEVVADKIFRKAR